MMPVTTPIDRPVMLILDEPSVYTARLTDTLSERLSHQLQVRHSTSLDATSDLTDVSVCLFSHTFGTRLERATWSSDTTFYLLCDTNDDHTVSRYQPLSALVRHVLPASHALTACASQSGHIDLIVSYDRRVRDDMIRAKLASAVDHGKMVYFLPLMPSFLVPDADLRTGSSLSDLILALETGVDLDDETFGAVFIGHAHGHHQARLAPRSDDITMASTPTISGLGRALRHRIDRFGASGYGLIAVAGISFEAILALAEHSDGLVLGADLHENQAADLECERLLASVPSHIAIERTPEMTARRPL